VDDSSPEWFSGTPKATKKFLQKFDWEKSAAIAHNAAFDMAILNWHFDIRPKKIIDTLSMARALHGVNVGGSLAKLATYYKLGTKGTAVLDAVGKRRADFTPEDLAAYGQYCVNDVELTRSLFDVMMTKPNGRFPTSELALIDLTIRMFTEPSLGLHKQLLEAHLRHVQEEKRELLESVAVDRTELMSNNKFAKLLESFGVTPPTKVSLKTSKESYAFSKTDEDFVALLAHPDIRVQALVTARLGTKSTLEESRTERFISIAERGTLPVPLRYYAAHTGRWGGSDSVNLQNIPRGSMIKKAICAPEGELLIDTDSSQIEARTLAWLAQQNDLVDAFARGDDVYRIMASAIYGKDVADIDTAERFLGKVTILGCGYGMGAVRFQQQLKSYKVELDLDECKRIIYIYRETYPRIVELWKQAHDAIGAMIGDRTMEVGRPGVITIEGTRGIKLPNGLYLQYPFLRWVELEEGGKPQFVYDTYKGRTPVPNRLYGPKLVENITQALARIVIGEQMLMINKKYPIALTVHDSVVARVPDDKAEAEAALEYMELCMKTRPYWALELPLNCESHIGATYG
jgi:DNA polymerase I-like protein with 3'-5' exonuclease and polymerase domains